MLPHRQLAELAQEKTLLQAQIAVRRWETAAAAVHVARPIAAIDRVVGYWHNMSPIVKGVGIPLGLLLWRNVRRRKGKGTTATTSALKLTTLFETLPLVIQGWKAIRDARSKRSTVVAPDYKRPARPRT